MKIDQIQFRLLEAEVPSFSGGTYAVGHRSTIQCRINTDDGAASNVLVGNESSYSDLFWKLLTVNFREHIVGADPLKVGALWAKMMAAADEPYLDRQEIVKAVSTVDVALWDLMGQITGVPVYKLIGGAHDRRPMIGIGGYYETCSSADGIREEVARYRKSGMAGIKFKVGALSLIEDAERVTVLRETAGDDFIIVVDSNMAWTPDESRAFVRMIEDLDVAWLEEPVYWRNQTRGLREVRNGRVPIAAGQSEISIFNCLDLLGQGSVDVLNVTANRGGGITGWLKLAAAAELYGVRMANVAEPHITMHTMAGIPNGTYVECYPDESRDPIWAHVYPNKPELVDGMVIVPDAPGLGLEIDPEAADRFAVTEWL